MSMTPREALALLVERHDDQQLTSEEWDNARAALKVKGNGTHTEVVVGLSGGVMTTVLYLRTAHENPNDTVECILVDYDEWSARDADKDDQTEEEFERERLNGRTWDDIVATHTALW